MSDTTNVCFSVQELWLLQAVVRHEVADQEHWHFPPASLELNEQIARAILLCEEQHQPEASMLLTRGDCLVIDATVPQSAKGVNGEPLGKSVLLKSFSARLRLDDELTAAEVQEDGEREQSERERLEAWRSKEVNYANRDSTGCDDPGAYSSGC